MLESAAAMWLDAHLSGFDRLFLSIQHSLADKAGGILTPFMKFISFMGEKGWPFFLLALIFILMADKRDLGVCIFGAVCCGALITNIILKDTIARLRPFENSIEYEIWWNAIGSPAEDGFSFPSGHVTACAAGMTAITLMRGKKWIIPSIIIVLLMAISRNYLMAHYPSDVLAAALIGVFSGFVSWLITQLIFRLLRRNRKKVPFFRFLLDFDIRDIIPLPFFKRKKAAPADGPDVDEDVKPYAGRQRKAEPARRTSARAAAPDFEAPARRTSAKAEAPMFEDFVPNARTATTKTTTAAPETETRRASAEAPKAAGTRTGGRHALPEGSGSASKRSSANYQGKH